jgi:hypothetical protein
LSSLESLAEDEIKSLERELHEIRNKKLVDKRYRIGDNYVSCSNWRQFDEIETNHNYRKNVFDHFIEKTEWIKPVIGKRFNKIRNIYEYEEGMNPLCGYLES